MLQHHARFLRLGRTRWRLELAAMAVAAFFAVRTTRLVLANFHPVLPHQLCRSAQPDPDRLADYIDRYRLQSIINLRGSNPTACWYQAERGLAQRRRVNFYDVPIDSGSPPSGAELRRLLDVLVHCPKPALIHCKSGIDRTSMASALAVLLLSDTSTPREALQQFSWRYGYMPWAAHAAEMEAPLYAYQDWLARHRLEHRADRFERWLLESFGKENSQQSACKHEKGR